MKQLYKTATTLKPKLSSGYDISNTLLLHIIEDIADPFTHIVNLSFSSKLSQSISLEIQPPSTDQLVYFRVFFSNREIDV